MSKCRSKTHPCPAGINCPEFMGWYNDNATAQTQPLQTVERYRDSSELIRQGLVKSFQAYFDFGARSSKKLDPLHGSIIQACMKHGVIAKGKGYGDNKEVTIQGAFGNKDCDITLLNEQSDPFSVIAVKFPMTNYQQNANNYFENSLGETANLKLAGFSVNQAIFLPAQLPYLDKEGIVKRIETIKDKDINKYFKLASYDEVVTPNNLYIQLLNIWGEHNLTIGERIRKTSPTEVSFATDLSRFSKENQIFLNSVSNFDAFIERSIHSN